MGDWKMVPPQQQQQEEQRFPLPVLSAAPQTTESLLKAPVNFPGVTLVYKLFHSIF